MKGVRITVVVGVFVGLACAAGCDDSDDSESMDLAHAAVHDMGLRIAETETDARGTSAFAIMAWSDEQPDGEVVEVVPLSDSVMMNFPDGSTLTVEFYTETMRVRGWGIR